MPKASSARKEPPARKAPPDQLPVQFREFEIERQAIDTETRTLEMSFSSEARIERWYGIEILDHIKGAMRTDRILAGAPLLDMHDWDKQIGVIEDVWIEKKRGNAKVRFSKNPGADEVFKDVVDKIKRNVSVGYLIHELVLEKQSDTEPDEYRITDWEPVEISIASVPADYSVGIERAGEKLYAVRIVAGQPNQKEPMEPKPTAEAPATPSAQPAIPAAGAATAPEIQLIREQTRTEESRRVRNIYEIGRRFGAMAEAETFVRDGKTLEEFQHFVLTEKLHATPIEIPESVTLGLSKKERSSYSILKAIRELSNMDAGAPRLSGLEKECSEAIEKQLRALGPDARRERTHGNSFFVPLDLRMAAPGMQFEIPRARFTRDMNVTIAPNVGLDFVAEEFIPSLIEYLRNALMVRAAGATVLTGLQGHVVIPKQVGPATAFWLTETGLVTPSDLQTHQIGLRPRRLAAQTVYSRQLVIQSSLDIEALIRSDLALTMAQKIDETALFGDPAIDANSPRGIFGYVGFAPDPIDPTDNVQTVAFDPAFANLYQSYIEFVVALDTQNIPMLRPAWIVNPTTWGRATGTPKFPNTGFPIVDPGERVLGYPYLRTNQIPSAGAFDGRVVFGDWAQLLIGQWAGVEMIVDPYTRAGNAQIVVTVNQFADLAVRYRRAFVVSTNPGGTLAETPPPPGEDTEAASASFSAPAPAPKASPKK